SLDASDLSWVDWLRDWINNIVVDVNPDQAKRRNGSVHSNSEVATHDQELLLEFFSDDTNTPPTLSTGERRVSLREQCWTQFQALFKPARMRPVTPDKPLPPLEVFRRRATELNYHYAGLYRGTFLLNYLFALFVVTIATFSLLLMGQQHTDAVEQFASQLDGHATDELLADATGFAANVSGTGATDGVLFGLALMKFGFVYLIFHNSRQANRKRWNDKAINYRYLAERLRTMFYLPLTGNFRPPTTSPSQLATRYMPQRSMEWLLFAIVRGLSPKDVMPLAFETTPQNDNSVDVLRVDPGGAIKAMCDGWLQGQRAYHSNNARTMRRMAIVIDGVSWLLNLIVIIIVIFDSAILACHLLEWSPEWLERVRVYSPYLVFASAVLPTAVAGLGGIRFQSECQRLADRSFVMQALLDDKAKRAQSLADTITAQQNDAAANLGSWSSDVIRLGESIAREMVEEVSEWSVVYTKELQKP
ncbi:MAG: hypothetical protein KDA87_22800, partial [Planctomycetales bacterium]|nr:hypothetical protein [Planctomycetales bacterium]